MSEYQNPEPPPGGPGSAPPPPSYGGPSAPAVAPPSVRQAVNLLFTLIALSVISVIVSLTQMGAAADQIRATNPGFTDAQVNAAVTAGIVVAAVIGLIFAALFLWLAFMIRKGANWARITLTVLFIIGILFQLFGLAGTAPTLVKLISVLQIVLEIAILVLLWRRPSSEYFAARRPA